MKKILCLAVGLFALNFAPVFGQPNPNGTPPSAPDFQQRLKEIVNSANAPHNQPPALTKFNLDFPGGTPKELAAAIERATGKPLNAIIPIEDADIQLPALKMNDVNAPQLFAALEAASRKTVAVQNGNFGGGYSQVTTGYGFHTSDSPVTDSSIWYFFAEKPSLPPVISTAPPQKICQFYNLDPYLNRGFKVDDITTAIATGWDMAGIKPHPELNYHQETKMLIAYGELKDLQTIQNVLQTLPATNAARNEIDSMKSQIKDLQDQVGALKTGILDLNSRPGEGRRPPPSEKNSGN